MVAQLLILNKPFGARAMRFSQLAYILTVLVKSFLASRDFNSIYVHPAITYLWQRRTPIEAWMKCSPPNKATFLRFAQAELGMIFTMHTKWVGNCI